MKSHENKHSAHRARRHTQPANEQMALKQIEDGLREQRIELSMALLMNLKKQGAVFGDQRSGKQGKHADTCINFDAEWVIDKVMKGIKSILPDDLEERFDILSNVANTITNLCNKKGKSSTGPDIIRGGGGALPLRETAAVVL